MSNPLRCVLDVSVSTKQFINDPLTPKVNQLLCFLLDPQTEIFVPDLFYIESTNTLWKYVRAGVYTAAEVQADLANLKALSLQVVSTVELIEEAFKIALNYGISAYDGAYVALSEQVQAPLLTLDQKLVNALATSPFEVQFFGNFFFPT
jgi:predicted nucleic acid-binding protein